jgi:hypothetical protein
LKVDPKVVKRDIHYYNLPMFWAYSNMEHPIEKCAPLFSKEKYLIADLDLTHESTVNWDSAFVGIRSQTDVPNIIFNMPYSKQNLVCAEKLKSELVAITVDLGYDGLKEANEVIESDINFLVLKLHLDRDGRIEHIPDYNLIRGMCVKTEIVLEPPKEADMVEVRRLLPDFIFYQLY